MSALKIRMGTPAPGVPGCVIYTRFSQRPDAAESESCEFQGGACRDYAFQKGYEIRREFDDPDRSGADEAREQLWNAIKYLRKGDRLIVYKRDRLARNMYLAEYINRAVARKGATIEAVSGDVEGEGPEQTLVRQVVAAMAEYERKLISKRTSDALRSRQREGRIVSYRLPYGYRRDPDRPGMMIEDPEEQKTLARILELHRKGWNSSQIAEELSPESARCGKWHTGVIRNIIIHHCR